jgi:hypothetical protein
MIADPIAVRSAPNPLVLANRGKIRHPGFGDAVAVSAQGLSPGRLKAWQSAGAQ